MISTKMEHTLNEQIQKEFYSAWLYLSIEAYFLSIDLEGFANWFHIQAQEERDHAIKLFNYINQVGGRIRLAAIQAPKVDFDSVEQALEMTLKHEESVTASIYNLVNIAIEEKDHKTNAFLQWYVTEQAEEEDNARKNINRFKMTSGQGQGLFMLDAELAKRVYIPIVQDAAT